MIPPIRLLVAALFLLGASLPTALAQRQGPPPVVSPESAADRQVTFRLLAPKAESVRLAGSDIPGLGQGRDMARADDGVWSVTVGPLPPGS